MKAGTVPTARDREDVARRAKRLVLTARAKYGPGWAFLSEEQQLGAVAIQIVSALISQDEAGAPPAVRRLQGLAETAMEMVAEGVPAPTVTP